MKRSKHQLLGSLAAALLAGTALMSCSQDDATDLSSGKLLDGKYPLVLTASIDDAGTRALTGKDSWTGNEEIGVRMGYGTDAVESKYVIGSTDGTSVSPAEGFSTIYWQKLDTATITAWYPYEAQTSVDISNQSTLSDFSSIDFLKATEKNQAVGNTVKLKFKHQMAKVTFTLTKGTDMDMSSATVKIAGYKTATFSEGVLTGADNDWITPYSSSYDATTLSITGEVLLVPQDMSNQQFIAVTDVTNNTTYYYTPTSANLEAGDSCTFNINVGGDYTYDSSSNTYTVYTEAGLNAWATAATSNMGTNCTLGNDITMSGTWTPVGTSNATSESYAGTFDGNNCTIKNLTISSDAVAHQGLIGYMGSGTVKDLTLVNVSITNTCTTTGSTGAVVGYNNGGTVSNCTVTGTVTGTENTGGVVGNNASGGTISNCSSSATVNGTAYTGGVVGLNAANSTITNCYSTGTVTGTGNYIGGVVGNSSGTITACYSTGTVSGANNVGGVVGMNSSGGTLTACYSTGAVTSSTNNNNIGGIVGNNQGTITACYSSGEVTSNGSNVGGAVGFNQSAGTVTACYWSNSQSSGVGSNSGTSETTQVSDSDWSTAASNMNTTLYNASVDWHYEVNSDSSGAPLILATGASSS